MDDTVKQFDKLIVLSQFLHACKQKKIKWWFGKGKLRTLLQQQVVASQLENRDCYLWDVREPI
jgi:hypothetical protein